MKKKVFVTREIPKPGLDILREHFEVDVFSEKRLISREEILERAKGCDGLLPLLTDTIDSEIMDKTGIKVISNYAVGYDNINIEAATKRKIPVTNTPGVLTDATADLTWSLILGISRRIVEADKFTREGKFYGWDPMLCLGGDFKGKTLGIVGLGRIGKAVAERAKGFGLNIVYHDHSDFPEVEKKLGLTKVSFEELLRISDYVTLHTPHTSETHKMIGEKELELMKPTAYLVNTSRGKVIDEESLAKALKEGKIAGAGLDVYYDEPDVHPELMKLDNAILLPHLGSASLETRTNMAIIAAENLRDTLLGKKPKNIVNPEIYD
ncbi:MAG: 2-hydroxyacid dehydrogenase [Candidatus Heimdallarchaeaceae archaeon]